MKKLKIAIYHNLPSGGAKRALYELVKHTNHQVDYDLYTPFEENEQYMPLTNLVNNVFTQQKQRKKYNKFFRGILMTDIIFMNRYEKKVAQKINSLNYDLVFIHHSVELQSPSILRYITHKKLYYMQEPRRIDYEYLFKRNNYQKNIIFRLLNYPRRAITKAIDAKNIYYADQILCNSYYSMESIIRAYGVTPKVNYLGVDTNIFRPSKKVKKENCILCVGALDVFKQQMFLLESIKSIKFSMRPKVIFVYDRANNDYKNKLIKYAKNNHIDLSLKMRVDDSELVNLYQKSLATICVASLEPFGFTPLESIACGTPAIAVKEAGYRETILDGVNGFLVDRNISSIRSAIEDVINNKTKLHSQSQMFDYVNKNWSWTTSANQLLKNYRLINEKN